MSFAYFQSLVTRQLPKQLLDRRFDDLGHKSMEALNQWRRLQQGDSQDLADTLSDELELEKLFTKVIAYSIKNPLIQTGFGAVEEQSIRVLDDSGKTYLLDNISTLYLAVQNVAADWYVSVFGVPKGQISTSSRDVMKRKAIDILTAYFGGKL